jgi:GNAT superfamily N-acetyltransferase
MALDGSTIVGAGLNRPLTRDEVMLSSVPPSLGPDEDPLIGNVLRMITMVHKQLDLFKALRVDTIFELGMLSVEPTHTGRGLAVKIMRKSLEFGAIRGFRAAKGDCTGPVSVHVCKRAGLVAVHKLLYDEYKMDNKVVFQNTSTRGPAMTVVAARLQDTEPYVRPLEELSKL